MGRLTEREPYWLGEEFWTYEMEPTDEEIEAVYEKLRHYENLEEQGLLLRLPCKVGGRVYYYHEEIEAVFPVEISTIHISDMGNGEKVFQFDGAFYNSDGDVEFDYEFDLEEFGETIFLTMEEAEKELKNRKCEEMQWLTWNNVKEWGEIQCPMLGDKCVMTYYREDEPCYYSYTAPFVQDGEIYYYRFDHDEGCWDESTYCIGEYWEGDWGQYEQKRDNKVFK